MTMRSRLARVVHWVEGICSPEGILFQPSLRIRSTVRLSSVAPSPLYSHSSSIVLICGYDRSTGFIRRTDNGNFLTKS